MLLLKEGRDSPLYHATTKEALIDILLSDTLMGKTEHGKAHLSGIKKSFREKYNSKYQTFDDMNRLKWEQSYSNSRQRGVSLTRDINFAWIWTTRKLYSGAGGIIVLDQAKLTKKYKIAPIDYWEAPRKEEYEEFLFGDINKISDYITHVYINITDETNPELLEKLIATLKSRNISYTCLDKPPKGNAFLKARKNP